MAPEIYDPEDGKTHTQMYTGDREIRWFMRRLLWEISHISFLYTFIIKKITDIKMHLHVYSCQT